MISRRRFLACVPASCVLVASVRPPRAAGAARRRVALLTNGANARSAPFYVAFERRLRDLGWIDGTTVTVDFVGPRAGVSMGEAVQQAVQRGPDVIVAVGPEEPIMAARVATTTIPIVMVAINYDPIAKGYVKSLARPEANVTGVFFRQLEVGAKQLEFLSATLPKSAKVVVVWDRNSADQVPEVESAARRLDVAIQKIEIRPPYDFEATFRAARQAGADGVLVLGSPDAFRERLRIGQLALRHRLPCAATVAIASDSAVLIGFGPDLNGLLRRAADYVDRILKGARPAELPVEEPTKFELVINLKTARALGVTIPPSLLLRADRVVE